MSDSKYHLSKAWKGEGKREKFSTPESETHQDPTQSILRFKAHEFLLRQEEAKQWLEEVLGIDIHTNTQMDFLEQLKSGTILAKLVNHFLEGKDKIKKIHQGTPGSQMEFMMSTDNTNNFFEGCRKLEFPKIYLFVFSDLWHRKNPLAVVHCIHSLAHFLERKGKTKIKIRDLSNTGMTFDSAELDKVQMELEKLEQSGITMDFQFDSSKLDEKSKVTTKVQKPLQVRNVFDDFNTGLSEDDLKFALVDPSKTLWQGRGIKVAFAGNDTNFTIVTRDSDGNDIETGGEDFKVTLTHKLSGEKFPVSVKDMKNGKYECHYKLMKTGPYDAEIFMNGKKLPGCPFTIQCKPNPITKTFEIISKLENEYFEGESYKIQFQSKDEYGNPREDGGDAFIPQIRYSKDAQSEPLIVPNTHLEDLGNGKYEMEFKLPIRGVYQLRLLTPDQKQQWDGFKPVILKGKGGEPPKIDFSWDSFKKGNSVLQIKASEEIFKNKRDRFISLFLKNPSDSDFTPDQKKLVENIIREKWKGWIKEYFNNLTKKMNPDENSWDDYEKREKELMDDFTKPFGFQYVSITDEKVDWSDYEDKKRKQVEKLKLEEDKQKNMLEKMKSMNFDMPTFNPNNHPTRPRCYEMDFWTIVRQMIVEAKKKNPIKLDRNGSIKEYIDKDIIVKEYLEPESLDVVRKRDVILYGKSLVSTTQRFIFEILSELENHIPEYDHCKNDFVNVAKQQFAKLKNVNDVFLKQMSFGEAPEEEVTEKMADAFSALLKSMMRELLVMIKTCNEAFEKIMYFNIKLSKEQVRDISLFSTFFKFDLADLYQSWQTIYGYELSSREKKILVYELIFYNQYGKQSNSYEVHVPLTEIFDSHIYKGKKTTRSAPDRARAGLVCGYKFAYIKFNHVLFEGIHTASIPGIDSQDSFSRQKIAKENAQELLIALAANHAKRFSRRELASLGNEPLNVPFTSLSLLTPFFFSKREDRQAFEQEKALFDCIDENLINLIQVDLHDGKEPMNVKVVFESPVFVNFGTNVIIKTLQMGSSFQRVVNTRKYGMRRFVKKVIGFINGLQQRKSDIRQELMQYLSGQQFNNREGMMYRENFGKLIKTLDNVYMLMNEIKDENQKKINILDAEMENLQEKFEKKLETEWYPYLDDMVSIQYRYLTKIMGTVNTLTGIEDKIYMLEMKHKNKHAELVEVEISFVTQIQALFQKFQAPPCWAEYFELALLEKDVFDLYTDMRDLYFEKQHERFSQQVIESKEVKEIDPYSIPVRILLLAFHMGEQAHYNCKSGKDRTGMMTEHISEYVELHAQYSEYPRVRAEKEKYNNHRKQIQNILSMNGGTLDITQLQTGIPGSKIDQGMSGRFYPGYYRKYRGLDYFTKLKYSTKDDWYQYLQ